jgi:hypothetical protein
MRKFTYGKMYKMYKHTYTDMVFKFLGQLCTRKRRLGSLTVYNELLFI